MPIAKKFRLIKLTRIRILELRKGRSSTPGQSGCGGWERVEDGSCVGF